MTTHVDKKVNSRFVRFLNGVERIGNKLPDPFILFVSLAVIVVILS
ncbi:MAG TPA: AbgT family transporter, partial [Chondromyces sp.]|nr:AbgT family transporter [Chondromyces sp.]